MDQHTSDLYLNILSEELVPALGCTEPIAIAYAAAKARDVLGVFPEQAILECSGNIIKNVKSVIVPNTQGLVGLKASVLAGLVAGQADKNLEVLSEVTPEQIEQIKKLLQRNLCEIRLLATDVNLHVILKLIYKDEYAVVEIKNAHTNLLRVEKNGRIIFQNDNNGKYLGMFTDRAVLTVKGIYEFANTVSLLKIRDVIERQIEYNLRIAQEGLRGTYGLNIGEALLAADAGDPVWGKMRAYAAAASEARMSGCGLPVVTNSGSGNQGIATSIPVIVYAKEMKLPEEKMYRGLVFANLLTVHQKTRIGRLSAFCGAICAACASGAAITYMKDGSLEQINKTISNMLADVSGIVCDGAKPSCAVKIASCLDAAHIAHILALHDKSYSSGDGIIKEDIEATIAAVGRLAKDGMQSTDTEILKIMLEV